MTETRLSKTGARATTDKLDARLDMQKTGGWKRIQEICLWFMIMKLTL